MSVLRTTASCCLLALAIALSGCGSSSDGSGDRRGGPRGDRGNNTPAVEAVQSRFGSLPLQERLSGRVRANDQVSIAPEINAPIVSVEVQNGDFVEAGEPLVRLQDDRYREQLQQAQSNLKIAQATAKRARATLKGLRAQLKRTERLAESQYESEQQLESLRAQVEGAEADVDEAEARVEQAEATIAERRTDLRQTVIRAPFSGYVGNRNAEVGQRVSPTTQLFTIGSLDSMIVETQVTDRMFSSIQVGQTARIQSPSFPDTVITAEVSRKSPFLNEQTYSAEVEIDVSNAGRLLTSGMYVEVDILYGETRQATLVPKAALYENSETGVRGVYVAPSLGSEVPVEAPELRKRLRFILNLELEDRRNAWEMRPDGSYVQLTPPPEKESAGSQETLIRWTERRQRRASRIRTRTRGMIRPSILSRLDWIKSIRVTRTRGSYRSMAR